MREKQAQAREHERLAQELRIARQIQQAFLPKDLPTQPGWQLTADAKTLNRAREFPTPEVASLYSAFVTGFAGALSLPVAVSVSDGQVLVTLHARRNRGRLGAVTDAVLDFARRLG